MAKSLRIDDVVVDGDAVTVPLTYGDVPLPLPAANYESKSFTSRAQIAALANELETSEATKDLMVMIRLAKAYRSDPTFGLAFKTAAKGSVTIDLAGAGSPIVIT